MGQSSSKDIAVTVNPSNPNGSNRAQTVLLFLTGAHRPTRHLNLLLPKQLDRRPRYFSNSFLEACSIVNKSILGLAFSCGFFKLCGFQLTDGAACVKHLVKHGAWLDFRGRAGFAEFIWAWVFTSSMLELSNGLGDVYMDSELPGGMVVHAARFAASVACLTNFSSAIVRRFHDSDKVRNTMAPGTLAPTPTSHPDRPPASA
jgi:hypothetical protein